MTGVWGGFNCISNPSQNEFESSNGTINLSQNVFENCGGTINPSQNKFESSDGTIHPSQIIFERLVFVGVLTVWWIRVIMNLRFLMVQLI